MSEVTQIKRRGWFSRFLSGLLFWSLLLFSLALLALLAAIVLGYVPVREP